MIIHERKSYRKRTGGIQVEKLRERILAMRNRVKYP